MASLLQRLLMPAISQRLLSPERLAVRRAAFERRRLARGAPHQVHYFHQVDDPYSALAAQQLPALAARYRVDWVPHLVPPPAASAAPERERLVAYSRRDAALLAAHLGLYFKDPGAQPDAATLARVQAQLTADLAHGDFMKRAGERSEALWRGLSLAGEEAGPIDVAQALAEGGHTRQQLGHYLGATFFYGGEWYWGLDRLHHLEQRLQALGAQAPGVSGCLHPPAPDLAAPCLLDTPPRIDFFFSLRSPYSAIVAPRVFELGRLTGAPVRLRFVLPMVMRGLPVPREKRRYIAADAAREARLRGTPFGRINDPVGRPTERGLALIPLAESLGRGQAYVSSFMQGVWAEGLDAGSDRGLRRIAERAGLDWAQAQRALLDEQWRQTAEANRQALLGLGLWGVPSFSVGACAVWGQDRLWAVTETLLSKAIR